MKILNFSQSNLKTYYCSQSHLLELKAAQLVLCEGNVDVWFNYVLNHILRVMVHVRPHLVHDLEQKVTISTRQDDGD